MAIEHRAGVEFRVAGRTLSGTILRYGDISPGHRERIAPGAFAPVPAVAMRLQHDPAMQILPPGAFVLNDGPRALRIRAELPENSAAMQLVKRGALNGFSVEFFARQERHEAGVRVIERADLVGIGLVDRPSYPGSVAEVRQLATYIPSRDPSRIPRRPRAPAPAQPDTVWAQSSIQTNSQRKSCKCLPAESKCRKVRFKPGAFDRTVREVEAGRHDVLAHAGGYRAERVLGDTRSRALILMLAGPESPEIAAGSLLVFLMQRVLGTVAGDALARSVDVAPPVVRPVVDDEKSDFEDDVEEGVREYSDAWIDSILVKYADDEASEGWDVLHTVEGESLDTTYPAPAPAPEPPSPPLRIPAWL